MWNSCNQKTNKANFQQKKLVKEKQSRPNRNRMKEYAKTDKKKTKNRHKLHTFASKTKWWFFAKSNVIGNLLANIMRER